ncbi:hypothetical protein PVBG_05732 [Plasmodium vivax Brazil I]|uniref:Uncharacterized protein n=1 Tax=Plasmodium vivax (strain Brazil I) TaxID=1033975 RepID=A0A0J9SL32_PLAV1|nr:hypothetical protein PVBG_05732 [Plasmodium vivax Brazil I]
MFVSLYNYSKRQCQDNLRSKDCEKYPEFMNFWLNYKLKKTGYSEAEQKQFYIEMTSNYEKFIDDNILENKLYVIVEKYFNNMNTLYQLYKMLYSPSELKYKKCDDFMDDFKKIYNEGLKKCYLHGDTNLGNGLESFKKIYESNKLEKLTLCNGPKVPTLPELSLVDTKHNNKLKKSNIASELLQYKYEYSMDNLPKINDNYV